MLPEEQYRLVALRRSRKMIGPVVAYWSPDDLCGMLYECAVEIQEELLHARPAKETILQVLQAIEGREYRAPEYGLPKMLTDKP